MSLRDYFVFASVFGSLPLILWRPWIGIVVWSWLAYMNPHRLTWGPAYSFSFSVAVGAVTIAAVVLHRQWRAIPLNAVTGLWGTFFVWTMITTPLALIPKGAAIEWDRWWKIQLFCLLTMMLMQGKQRIHILVWVIVLSLGFYGVKGGIFGIVTGGDFMVLGPPRSFIMGNTAIGLALIMVLPLMRYCHLEAKNRWVRLGLAAAMGLTLIAIIATHSRGALLGIIGAGVLVVMKSSKRLWFALLAVILSAVVLSFMPQHWFDKMATIQTYEEDRSALGRINAWWFAFNLAVDHPIVGGGFRVFTRDLFRDYAPEPENFHDAHSIFFEVLAEQGFIGLFIYLALGITSYLTASQIIRRARGSPDLVWARHLAGMIQVAIAGYAISGAFLGLAYFDFYYHLLALLVLTKQQVDAEWEKSFSVGYSPPAVGPPPDGSPAAVGSAEAARREGADV